MPFSTFTALRADANDVLQAMLDQSQDCVKLISTSGELEYMNANGRRAMAIADFSQVMGKKWPELWPEESRDLVSKAVRHAETGRTSRFEAYCPTMAGEPRWWDVAIAPIRDNDGAITHILATSRDITLQNAERQSERERRARAEQRADMRDTVSREMRHRVKNLLAIVTSIGRLTARQRPKTEDFIHLFEQRIGGLAAAQQLLVEHEDHRAGLPELISTLLGEDERDDRVAVGEMPAVTLDDRSAQSVALIIGELLTNAHKYGALSQARGQVFLSAVRHGEHVAFRWEETCTVPIDTPGREGSGMMLMRRISAGQPRPLTLEWKPDGVLAQFDIATS